MNRFFSNTFKVGLLACVSAAASLSGTAQAQMVPEGGGMKQELADKGYNFRLYGKFRPKVTFSDAGDDNSIDVRDDSSRVGIQGKARINDNLSAVLRGEWKVGIQNGGDFGDVRLAFVGLESKNAGFFGIGTQWNPYYDIAAAQVDVLYNASDTPVGYGGVGGPFRNDNFIKYAHSVGAVKFSAGIQADGSGNNADGVDAFAAGVGFDVGNGYIGIAYWRQNRDNSIMSADTFVKNGTPVSNSLVEQHSVDISYTYMEGTRTLTVPSNGDVRQNVDGDYVYVRAPNNVIDVERHADVNFRDVSDDMEVDRIAATTFDEKRTHFGIGASFNINEDLYVSALYQDVEYDREAGSGHSDADPSSLDIAAVYSFGDGMKLLAGAFTYDTDDGDDSRTKGMTLGLAKRLDKGMDVYVDWLRQDPDAGDATNQFNVGFRYSFDVGLL